MGWIKKTFDPADADDLCRAVLADALGRVAKRHPLPPPSDKIIAEFSAELKEIEAKYALRRAEKAKRVFTALGKTIPGE